MTDRLHAQRRQSKIQDRSALAAHQLDRFNQLLSTILPDNTFYATKLASVRLPVESLDALSSLPLTTKDELVAGMTPEGFAPHGSFPLSAYTRMHRTSGTRGRPMTILDTTDDWNWWIETWQYVLDAAEITAADRALMAFSFGPFVGFWSAYDALVHRGALVIPAGGLNTMARLELLRESGTTCVCCTPTYAMRMADTAAEHGFPLSECQVRALIVAGEPGGSIPSVRSRIEEAWQAQVFDHSGATEIGPWGFPNTNRTGLHVVESEFIAEFLPWETAGEVGTQGADAEATGLFELVLTPLGRLGMPLIRYRTGDLVKPTWPEGGDCRFVVLQSGILGRADDMVIIRGVNVFPSSIEAIVRRFPEVDEFRVTATRTREMDQLSIEVEDRQNDPDRIAQAVQMALGLRVPVVNVPRHSLPRFEAKARRFVDRRE